MKITDIKATTVTVPLEAPLRHAAGCHWGRFVRTIVEGYGGSVAAESEPGVGATFTVRMPASRTGVFARADGGPAG